MRAIVCAFSVALVVGLVPASAAEDDQPEGCLAINPVQPKCTFTATENTAGPVSGAAGTGDWVVKIKRGKKSFSLRSTSVYGEPSSVEFLYKKGDKVTAVASSGGMVVAGGD
jgi:hypothetical protein